MKKIVVVSWLGLLFAMFCADIVHAETKRYALIFGANEGGFRLPILRFDNRDAEKFSQAMLNFGGISEQNIILRKDVSREKFFQAIDSFEMLLKAENSPSELIFYYSGHSDEQGLLLQGDRVSYKELKARFEKIPLKIKVFILDSCASGTLILTKGGALRSPFIGNADNQSQGYVVMTSSAADESSQESERLKSSFFTHFLVAGLRGAADINGDRQITLTEAYQYAYNQTIEITSRTHLGIQHPSYDFQLQGRGDFVLTDLRRMSSGLSFPQSLVGNILVKRDTGEPVSELNKKLGTVEAIALEPGSYEVIVNNGPKYYQGLWRLKDQNIATVNLDQMAAINSEQVVRRGADGPLVVTDSAMVRGSLWASESFDSSREKFANVHFTLFAGEIDELHGLGLGVIGHASRNADGLVSSLAFNLNREFFNGVELTLGLNQAGFLTGMQVGGINVAEVSRGLQAGVINLSENMTGIQLGLINVAKNMTGIQLGLITISERSRGFAFAPFMVSRDGILRGEAWIDSLGYPYASLRSGTRYVYTALHVGGQLPSLGVSFGLRLPLGHNSVQIDYGWFLYLRNLSTPNPSQTQKAYFRDTRLFYNWQWRPDFGLLFGVSRVHQIYEDPLYDRLESEPLLSIGSPKDSAKVREQLGILIGLSYSFYKEQP